MNACRRDLLRFAVTGSALSLIPPVYGQSFIQETARPVPAGTVSKFNPDGTVRPFAGNTVISHLPAQCLLRDAMVTLRDSLRASPFAARFALLPTDSYHMTVFGGANDQGRSTQSWPGDIAMDTPIEVCTRILETRLASFWTDCPMPIRMKIDAARTVENDNGCGLLLAPADEAQNKAVRSLRDRLAEVFRFRAEDHATYQFHISIAYQVAAMAPPDVRAYRALMANHVARIISAVPLLELGLPEYCSFRDMYRYDVLRYLQTA